MYVELNDSWERPHSSKLDTPEFHRELPGKLGKSYCAGILAVLKEIGYTGPVVCEPFNRRMGEMALEEAVTETKEAMWKTFKKAEDWPADNSVIWKNLVGSQPYYPDPVEESVRAGGLRGDVEEKEEGDYVGEGGLVFSEDKSEAAVISTMTAEGRSRQVSKNGFLDTELI